MKYRGHKTKEISFPLGGIGSGSIGLAGNGRLIDWDNFNKPDKGSLNAFTHFAVKAETKGKVVDARVLIGDQFPPYSNSDGNIGTGPSRWTMQGFPHFRDLEFNGEFPLAAITFNDKTFPARIKETAFNPFIPLNDKDSSIPAAFFSFEIKNTTSREMTYTVSGMLANRHAIKPTHHFEKVDKVSLLKLGTTSLPTNDFEYGDMSIATDADDISYQQYAYRGQWFDTMGIYWLDFTKPGKFTNRKYPDPKPDDNVAYENHGIMAAHVTLKPGESKSVRFVISWNFPNMMNYWNPEKQPGGEDNCKPQTWKNYYATLFDDSAASAAYALGNWDSLYRQTLAFKKSLFSSTLPAYVLDAVSANISTLKSPTVFRLTDGSLYGFEGCYHNAGSCEGSCTHVWNYAYATPFLFPRLERSLRDLEYQYSMRDDGKVGFRLQTPLGRGLEESQHACVDGQFGGVIKSYREWKVSGDEGWLQSNWNAIKKSIEFAWSKTNEDQWDLDKDGVLEGRQHHTLDTELFGPSSYLTGFYLAALKAGAEMAEHLGECETAKQYRRLFEQGKTWVNKNLFNGEYFHQQIDVTEKNFLSRYKKDDKKFGSIEKHYWSQEHRQLKHQIANGCHCDQIIAQWHANLVGLGEIFDRRKTKKALKSIHKYNFKKSMRDIANPCRLFSMNDEAGLIICDWPKGDKPACPLTYAEETMNGFEYQAAGHMIQEGLVDEGLEIVRAVRDRYDGEKRNPWNEFEAGSNYVRSMASFALLSALSGFEFDMTKKHIGFAPKVHHKNFQCFWSLEDAWGIYRREADKVYLKVQCGELMIRSFSDSLFAGRKKVHVANTTISKVGQVISFDAPFLIKKGKPLVVTIG